MTKTTEHHRYAGKWSDSAFPKTGWSCLYVHDNGESQSDDDSNMVLCEMCELAKIRYVHHMVHPDAGSLDVGCVCSGHMEGKPEEATARDKSLQNRARNLTAWLTKAWAKNTAGQDQRIKDKHIVCVYYRYGNWMFSVTKMGSRYPLSTPNVYQNVTKAKKAAFLFVEEQVKNKDSLKLKIEYSNFK